jgi:hypothetical protein
MNRENAIAYLQRKDKISDDDMFDKEEEALIEKVMKEGKIYGDPYVELK